MARQTIDPATLGRNSAPLEGYDTTSVQIRLARGSDDPRVRGPVSIESQTPPQASFRLARGGHGAPPIPTPPAGAFNALTPAGVQVKREPTPLHAWESCPATAPPTPRHCAMLCGVVSNRPAALYHPLPYGRCPAPSKKDGGTLDGITHNYFAPARDGAVTSGQWERSPPSPSALCGHLGHCTTIPDAMEHAATGHRHASHCTSPGRFSP
jgi:hypothetical protein